ncbi:MAG: hypothetical protein AABX52_04595 [Nanoarchaeota archaeon]
MKGQISIYLIFGTCFIIILMLIFYTESPITRKILNTDPDTSTEVYTFLDTCFEYAASETIAFVGW